MFVFWQPLCLRLCVHELMLRELRTMGLYEPESDSPWCHSEMPKDDRDVLPSESEYSALGFRAMIYQWLSDGLSEPMLEYY